MKNILKKIHTHLLFILICTTIVSSLYTMNYEYSLSQLSQESLNEIGLYLAIPELCQFRRASMMYNNLFYSLVWESFFTEKYRMKYFQKEFDTFQETESYLTNQKFNLKEKKIIFDVYNKCIEKYWYNQETISFLETDVTAHQNDKIKKISNSNANSPIKNCIIALQDFKNMNEFLSLKIPKKNSIIFVPNIHNLTEDIAQQHEMNIDKFIEIIPLIRTFTGNTLLMSLISHNAENNSSNVIGTIEKICKHSSQDYINFRNVDNQNALICAIQNENIKAINFILKYAKLNNSYLDIIIGAELYNKLRIAFSLKSKENEMRLYVKSVLIKLLKKGLYIDINKQYNFNNKEGSLLSPIDCYKKLLENILFYCVETFDIDAIEYISMYHKLSEHKYGITLHPRLIRLDSKLSQALHTAYFNYNQINPNDNQYAKKLLVKILLVLLKNNLYKNIGYNEKFSQLNMVQHNKCILNIISSNWQKNTKYSFKNIHEIIDEDLLES